MERELIRNHLNVDPIVWGMTWEIMKEDDQLKKYNDETEPIEEIVMLDNNKPKKNITSSIFVKNSSHFDKKNGNITPVSVSVTQPNIVPNQACTNNKEYQHFSKKDNPFMNSKFKNVPKNSKSSAKNYKVLTLAFDRIQDKKALKHENDYILVMNKKQNSVGTFSTMKYHEEDKLKCFETSNKFSVLQNEEVFYNKEQEHTGNDPPHKSKYKKNRKIKQWQVDKYFLELCNMFRAIEKVPPVEAFHMDKEISSKSVHIDTERPFDNLLCLVASRKNLSKCKTCNFKKRKCLIDKTQCVAIKKICTSCKKVGHFPKSPRCKTNKLIKKEKSYKHILNQVPKSEEKLTKNNLKHVKRRIYELEEYNRIQKCQFSTSYSLPCEEYSSSQYINKSKKPNHTTLNKKLVKPPRKTEGILPTFSYWNILFTILLVTCLPKLVNGSWNEYDQELSDLYWTYESTIVRVDSTVLGIGLLLFIVCILLIFLFFCCLKHKYSKKNDIEKYELQSLIKNTTAQSQTVRNFSIEDEIGHDSEKYQKSWAHRLPEFYAFDTIEDLDKLTECNHHSLYLEFDRYENINKAFLHNKSLKTTQRIENNQIERWEQDIMTCSQNNPMQQNLGKGKRKSDNEGLISMKSGEPILQKCSLISVVLALFNLQTFKLCMSKISEDFSICSVGSSECLCRIPASYYV